MTNRINYLTPSGVAADIVAGLVCLVLFPYTVSIWVQIARMAVAQ